MGEHEIKSFKRSIHWICLIPVKHLKIHLKKVLVNEGKRFLMFVSNPAFLFNTATFFAISTIVAQEDFLCYRYRVHYYSNGHFCAFCSDMKYCDVIMVQNSQCLL